VPRRGLDNTLLALEYGKPVFTAQFWLLAQQVNDLRADIFICDNVAQTYGGNENDRHQVTVFVNGLSGMVQDRDFAAVCLGHVARSPGSEFSGSSAWENACRMRWYMGPTLPDQKAADDDPTDPDLVYVAKRKANYTERDYRRLRFRGGLFVLDTPVPGSAGAGSLGAQETVIRALRQLAALNRTCSVSPGPSYFPKLAQQYGLLDGVSKADFVKAMRQLEVDGKIGTRQVGQYPNRVAKMGLVVLGDP
jgi:RecA-family ATPase